MQPYIEFFMRHWELSALFVVLLLVLIITELRSRGGARGVTPQETVYLMNHEKGVVLDVRTKEQFTKGHILHALNIPKETVKTDIKKLQKHQGKPIIVVCEHGRDSVGIAGYLHKEGFAETVSLSGGLSQWSNAGLPLQQEVKKGG